MTLPIEPHVEFRLGKPFLFGGFESGFLLMIGPGKRIGQYRSRIPPNLGRTSFLLGSRTCLVGLIRYVLIFLQREFRTFVKFMRRRVKDVFLYVPSRKRRMEFLFFDHPDLERFLMVAVDRWGL